MRVLLLNPPVPTGRFTNRDLMGGMGIDDHFGVDAGPRFVSLLKYEGIRMPVLSLAYGAALLQNHEVIHLDQSRQDPDSPEALQTAAALRPDWIVAATSFAFLGAELRYLERLRTQTSAQRLLLGYTATHFARDILQQGLAEAVAVGDPEVALEHLAKGSLTVGARGVYALDADGRPRSGGDGYVENLDALPFPAWEAFPTGDYAYFPLLKKRPFATLLSSRGCPYVCNFCPYPTGQGAPFRARSPRSVADEMTRAVERFGVRSLLFRDPTFSMDIERSKALCREVLARGLRLDWGIETRLDRLDDELIELLGRAGCRSCEFGVDPLDADVRRASKRKGIVPDRAEQLIARMEDHGIATAGLAVIGLPEQSRDEVDDTIAWVQGLRLSYINYEVATPFPGTPLYAEAVRKGWTHELSFGELLRGDPKLTFNGVIELDEMKTLQDRALRAFYIRPRKVAREVFNRELFNNVRFLAGCAWRFMKASAFA